MEFANKILLWLLALIPLLGLLKWFAMRHYSIRFPSLNTLRELQLRYLSPRHFGFIVLSVVLILLILALARPRKGEATFRVTSEGVDIMLVLDISGSMRAEDFVINGRRENRLYVAKQVTEDFIEHRTDDRLGLVVFAGRAFTQCPLTLDHPVLLNLLDNVEIGQADDGTAIGSALLTAVNRLKDSEAKSRVVMLLTDGVNNAGQIDPMTAADIAERFGVKVYTIGVGTKGLAPYPMQDIFGNIVYKPIKIEVDDETLEKIAQKTQGQYFRATDTRGLKRVYATIDSMEKHEMESLKYTHYEEKYRLFLVPGLVVMLLMWLLTGTYFLQVP
jgi:Ca-activated chloride channel homolog